MERTPLAVQLGRFVAALRFEDLPPPVVDKATAVVNQAVTVAMAGFGILGVAATAAKLVGLGASQTTHAIALAASFAGSLIEGQRTGARDADFAEAQAARSGLWAATLAAKGFQGAPTALEGDGGFYHAFTGSHRGDLSYSFTGAVAADLDDVVADLGQR